MSQWPSFVFVLQSPQVGVENVSAGGGILANLLEALFVALFFESEIATSSSVREFGSKAKGI